VTGALQVVEIDKHLLGARHIARRALDLDRIRLQIDGNAESILHQVQVFIASAKQGFDLGADFNFFLHRGLDHHLKRIRAVVPTDATRRTMDLKMC